MYLWPGRQMDSPEFTESGCLCGADELVWGAAQEVAAGLVAERPSAGTIFGDADLEAGASVALLILAEHVAERVHGQVLVQM